MVNWIGLLVPIAYITILIGSLATFSSLYRKRKAAKSSSLAPWFPPHTPRDIYLSLLHLENQKVPDTILKAALLRRAAEDISRVMAIRMQKQSLAALLARGSVGDDLWQRFLRAEKEIEEELRDVVNEANAFAPNWGSHIFQSANEMANNYAVRARAEEVDRRAKAEREWWDTKRSQIQDDFMKELDSSGATVGKKGVSSSVSAVSAGASVTTGHGSDEDGVLVEGGGPAAAAKMGKKKKNKK